MPSVIVVIEPETDEPSACNHDRRAIQLKERVTSSDVSDPHVAAQLIQRIGWGLADAENAERAASRSKDRYSVTTAVVPEPGASADATSSPSQTATTRRTAPQRHPAPVRHQRHPLGAGPGAGNLQRNADNTKLSVSDDHRSLND